MAKSATGKEAKAAAKEAKATASGPLAEVNQALLRGDVKSARRALEALPADATEADREQAARLSERLGLDLTALAIAGVVLLVIALAATLALFMRRG